jgi:hypothetical protein
MRGKAILRCVLLALLLGAAASPAHPRRHGEPRVSAPPVADPAFATEMHERPSDFSPDGRQFFFTRSERDFSASVILVTEFREDRWSAPEPARFGRSGSDSGGSFSPDGEFYFTSRRPIASPGPADQWNLWRAERHADGWAAPQPLPAPVNTEKAECCIRALANGTLYFASDRAGSWDIYRAVLRNGSYEVTRLGDAVNSPYQEWPSYVDPEERLLLFSSIRPTGLGSDDIYVALREDGDWKPAQLLGYPLNSPAFDDGAILGPGQEQLFFSSRRGLDGSSNILELPAKLFEELAEESRSRSLLDLLWENVGLNPESAIALNNLGNAYVDAGDTATAAQVFELALDLIPADPHLEAGARERMRRAVEEKLRRLRPHEAAPAALDAARSSTASGAAAGCCAGQICW